ncbi:hypothetical protein CORC01_08640 [Colletotrichum orchidophilum]|uniref:Uncharacterized protein n=1 Tax=Colletotrichum orchidophilum TaxID=1209926 RepID=A0A1G4B450_9PEZI|nr:uncharacterized protein CORC01_08640 [Colletotrichum orchidophilum]OHE96103.1 hypothetical protein CORC01_08640 [Colletotrichum orchidophilum]
MRFSVASGLAFIASQVTANPVPAVEVASVPALPTQLEYINFDDIPWANTTDEHVPLSKRTVGGIYICTDFNWGGTCGYKVQPLGVCIVLTSPWLNSISSIGPDPGTLVRTELRFRLLKD